MRLLVSCALLIGIGAPLMAAPAEIGQKTSGFPGDYGRLFDGLPLPDTQKPPRPQFPPYAPGPSIEQALTAAQAAVKACAGYSVAVSVVDTAGMPKIFYVPDTTAGFHAYTALRKAITALSFGKPTSAVAAMTRQDAKLAARIRGDGNLLAFAGGLPVYRQGKLIGAIGISGAEPSAVDERCAEAGLTALEGPQT